MSRAVEPLDSPSRFKDRDDEVENLTAALESGEPELVADALRVIVRARGAVLALEDGADLKSLLRLREAGRQIELRTVLGVLSSLCIKLIATRRDQAATGQAP